MERYYSAPLRGCRPTAPVRVRPMDKLHYHGHMCDVAWTSYRERYSTVTWTRFARAVLHGRKGTVAPYRLHYKDTLGTDQPISSMDEHGPKLRYTIGGGRPA